VVHPVKNILNRLRWDPEESPELYVITYRHRGAPGDVKQIRASRIGKLGKSYFTISENSEGEESTIPFHRILEIRSLSDSRVIWKSRKFTG
jgi:hypothetical protein